MGESTREHTCAHGMRTHPTRTPLTATHRLHGVAILQHPLDARRVQQGGDGGGAGGAAHHALDERRGLLSQHVAHVAEEARHAEEVFGLVEQCGGELEGVVATQRRVDLRRRRRSTYVSQTGKMQAFQRSTAAPTPSHLEEVVGVAFHSQQRHVAAAHGRQPRLGILAQGGQVNDTDL